MPITSSCVREWVQTGVPPWLFMPELPPDGATQQCQIVNPTQQQAELAHGEPEPKPEPEHENWLEHAGHSLGAILKHERHK